MAIALYTEKTIDIGSPAIDRASFFGIAGYTMIDTHNPANISGTLTSIEVWAYKDMTGLRVGTFYLVSGTTYKCRDSETIGAVTAGSKQTFAVSLTVQAGDVIGCYFATGDIEVGAGGTAFYYKNAEYIDPGDQVAYTYWSTDTMSLCATDITTIYGADPQKRISKVLRKHPKRRRIK